MAQSVLSASLRMTQNWEEWLIYQRVVLPSRGTSTGESGTQEPHEVQQGEVQSPAAGEEQPQAPAHAQGCPVGKQLSRKDLEVLVDTKLK